MIDVTVPWQPRILKQPAGLRLITLDPARGFVPVSGRGSWKRDKMWRREEFAEGEARLVDGLWMPIRLREVIAGSPLGPGKANVHETTVLSIELGKTSSQDLKISIPEGGGPRRYDRRCAVCHRQERKTSWPRRTFEEQVNRV